VSCARNALYELRIDNARALLDREAASNKVDHFAPATKTDIDLLARLSDTRIAGRVDISHASARTAQCREGIEQVQTHSELLRREIEEGKAEISRRKALLTQRRSEHSPASKAMAEWRKTSMESVQKAIRRTSTKATQQHQRMVDSRAFLCREAATLYGLKQRKKRGKDGVIIEDYFIGEVGIVDLRHMNSASHLPMPFLRASILT
jgi:hypothetical protein